jgi:hypothetical protein
VLAHRVGGELQGTNKVLDVITVEIYSDRIKVNGLLIDLLKVQEVLLRCDIGPGGTRANGLTCPRVHTCALLDLFNKFFKEEKEAAGVCSFLTQVPVEQFFEVPGIRYSVVMVILVLAKEVLDGCFRCCSI